MGDKNPLVFMDVSVDKLFKDVAPATVENFRALCTGEKGIGPTTGMPLHYKDSFFYEVWKGYSYIKGGDFYSSLGTCGESIYGANFPDEMPKLKCDQRGLLCMDICDRLGIGSHFLITLKPDHKLERFQVVFGKVVSGVETLDMITEAPLGASVQVTDSGEYNNKDDDTKADTEKKKKKKRTRN